MIENNKPHHGPSHWVLLGSIWFNKHNAHCTSKHSHKTCSQEFMETLQKNSKDSEEQEEWTTHMSSQDLQEQEETWMHTWKECIDKKKTLSPHQAPTKFIITQWMTMNTKESANFFVV
jgi:hypothetical protein